MIERVRNYPALREKKRRQKHAEARRQLQYAGKQPRVADLYKMLETLLDDEKQGE